MNSRRSFLLVCLFAISPALGADKTWLEENSLAVGLSSMLLSGLAVTASVKLTKTGVVKDLADSLEVDPEEIGGVVGLTMGTASVGVLAQNDALVKAAIKIPIISLLARCLYCKFGNEVMENVNTVGQFLKCPKSCGSICKHCFARRVPVIAGLWIGVSKTVDTALPETILFPPKK